MISKVVGVASAQGARAVMCRKAFGKDAVEFALVDIHSWTVDEQGTYIANVFDEELNEPVTLEWMVFNYGGITAISHILETKTSALSDVDMATMERRVRKREARLTEFQPSPGAALYHARVKAMYESTHLAA